MPALPARLRGMRDETRKHPVCASLLAISVAGSIASVALRGFEPIPMGVTACS